MPSTTTTLDLDTVVTALPAHFSEYELKDCWATGGVYVVGGEWEAHQAGEGVVRLERRATARPNSEATLRRKIRDMVRELSFVTGGRLSTDTMFGERTTSVVITPF